MQISNNTILITGGSSGIGLELAKQLSPLNNKVIITGRDPHKLANAKKILPKLHTIQSDVTKPEEITRLFEQVTKDFPELNILINNAGIMRSINLHETQDLTELTCEVETNLNGPIRMTQAFLEFLKTRPYGAIMNVTSGLAFVPLPMSPVYCATKAGLHSYTLSLRVQLKNTKIKVFELAPPATQTPLLGSFDHEDMRGISIMRVETMVQAALDGLRNEILEIRPGQSNQLKFMSRLAPEFILNQMSKPVDRMLAAQKH